MEYVSKRIAEIAKSKGMYVEMHLDSDSLKEPTYQQLIEWIFDFDKHFNYSVHVGSNISIAQSNKIITQDRIEHLEFWYNTLIPELTSQFNIVRNDEGKVAMWIKEPTNEYVLEALTGMLINWFEKNGYTFDSGYNCNKNIYYFDIKEDNQNLMISSTQKDTKQQARHKGILKCFELLKEK
jgi:hypothetical protein